MDRSILSSDHVYSIFTNKLSPYLVKYLTSRYHSVGRKKQLYLSVFLAASRKPPDEAILAQDQRERNAMKKLRPMVLTTMNAPPHCVVASVMFVQ